MEAASPPTPPELPEGVDRRPRWPAWYAIAGFAVALVGTLITLGIAFVVLGVDPDEDSATLTIVGVLLQTAVFVGTAVWFASMTRRPRAWHFGLNPTRFWPAVGWAALGMFSFYLFAGIYSALVDPEAEQGITEALGADEGSFGLIVAGLMVIVVAPVGEELFFRGFFYRALRSRFSILVAALLDGLLFGVIHYDANVDDILLILPVLAVLGFMFCLVYEKTGSLFPVIALHAINNSLAYAVQTDGEGTAVSLAVGPLMVAACALVPRGLRPAPAGA